MPKPILMAVHEQLSERAALQRELTSRYSSGYDIVCEASPVSALERLDEFGATTGANVLILFAASQMAMMSGTEFLERAHELHPHAQRVLLIPWGQPFGIQSRAENAVAGTFRSVRHRPQPLSGRGLPLRGHRASARLAAPACGPSERRHPG